MRERDSRSGDPERSPPTETNEGGRAQSSSGGPAVRLQRALGNSAVQTLHENGDIDARGAVSDPGDRSEREAERVATSMPSQGESTSEGGIERPDSGTVQSPSNSRLTRAVRGELSAGRRLPAATREHYEVQFDADFSSVRIHEGRRADELARSVGADAFTLGNDVVFAKGNYAPDTAAGGELLAHELTHVLQQRSARPGPIQREVSDDPGTRVVFDDSGQDSYPTVKDGDTARFGWDARGNDFGWIPPFGGSRVSTYAEARDEINDLMFDLSEVESQFFLEPEADLAEQAYTEAESLLGRLEAEGGSLTREHARESLYVAAFYFDVVQASVAGMPEDISEGLMEVRAQSVEFDRIYQRLSDSLHNAFIAGANPETLKSVSSALSTVGDAKSHVDNILGAADQIDDVVHNVDLPDFISQMSTVSQQFDRLLSGTTDLLDATELMLDFAGDAPSESMQMINQFQNFINGIDFAMGFVNKLPVFNTYWSNYLKPLTDQCIEGLTQLAEGYDRQGRQLAYLDAWEAGPETDPEDPPQIPEEYADKFPGGQPVLDYMWGLVNETDTSLDWTQEAAVATFFQNYEDHIRAVMPIEVSDGDIRSMVEARPRLVWMMLYGGLPTQRH